MDYSKEKLEELFQIGNKILTELQTTSQKKSADLENADRRFADLKKNLQSVLDNAQD